MERKDRKKSKKPLILTISGIVIVAGLAGGYFAYGQWQSAQELKEAEKTAKTFLTHLSKQEFDQFTALLSDASLKQNDFDETQVVEKYQAIFSGIDAQGIKSSDVKVKKQKKTSTHLAINLK